jgi:hypothetical protein
MADCQRSRVFAAQESFDLVAGRLRQKKGDEKAGVQIEYGASAAGVTQLAQQNRARLA